VSETNKGNTDSPHAALEVYQPKSLAQAANVAGIEATATIQAAREKALVEARYVVAMRQPRDIDVVRSNLLRECKRPSFAEVARYHKPIGKGIEGPSIRFAEAAIQAMGNVSVETPTIDENQERRVMRVTVTDIERNASYSQEIVVNKTIERLNPGKDLDRVISQRTNSANKMTYLLAATDDDVLNKQNALVSKAIRTLGLRLVPGWLVEECMRTVIATAADSAAKDPEESKRKLFDAFMSVGVTADQVKAWLGHDVVVLQPQERITLGGIYNAIKDGDATWDEVMVAREAARAGERKPEEKTPEQKAAEAKPGTTNLKVALGTQKSEPSSPGGASPAASGSPKPA
jgi:hypothetical protein